MVSRVLKNKLRGLMRAAVRSAEERHTTRVVATFLHRMLHDQNFWKFVSRSLTKGVPASLSSPSLHVGASLKQNTSVDIKRVLMTRYPGCLHPSEVLSCLFFLSSSPPKEQMINNVWFVQKQPTN